MARTATLVLQILFDLWEEQARKFDALSTGAYATSATCADGLGASAHGRL